MSDERCICRWGALVSPRPSMTTMGTGYVPPDQAIRMSTDNCPIHTRQPSDLLTDDNIQAFAISGDHEVCGDNNPGRQV